MSEFAPAVVRLIAFEELHVGEMVRLYYGKVKRTTNPADAIGLIVPMINPQTIKRNEPVLVVASGIIYLEDKELSLPQ